MNEYLSNNMPGFLCSHICTSSLYTVLIEFISMRSIGCIRWVALGYRTYRMISFLLKNSDAWIDKWLFTPLISSNTGRVTPLSLMPFMKPFSSHETNKSESIQPDAEFPNIPHGKVTWKSSQSCILGCTLAYTIIGGIKWPAADDVSNVVIWFFDELVPA